MKTETLRTSQKGSGVRIVSHRQDTSITAQLERNTGRGAKKANRQAAAKARKLERSKRSPQEQLELIKSYPGECKKETARLQKQIRKEAA